MLNGRFVSIFYILRLLIMSVCCVNSWFCCNHYLYTLIMSLIFFLSCACATLTAVLSVLVCVWSAHFLICGPLFECLGPLLRPFVGLRAADERTREWDIKRWSIGVLWATKSHLYRGRERTILAGFLRIYYTRCIVLLLLRIMCSLSKHDSEKLCVFIFFY